MRSLGELRGISTYRTSINNLAASGLIATTDTYTCAIEILRLPLPRFYYNYPDIVAFLLVPRREKVNQYTMQRNQLKQEGPPPDISELYLEASEYRKFSE